jgi:Domain of unknown function (DUF4439)
MSGGPIAIAWQQALAAEYAAAFGYGALGPRLVDPAQIALARSSQQAHSDLVAQSQSQLTAAGLTPVAPAASYPLPYPVADAATARQLALRLEDATASAWRYLFATAAVEGSVVTGGSAAASASPPTGTNSASSSTASSTATAAGTNPASSSASGGTGSTGSSAPAPASSGGGLVPLRAIALVALTGAAVRGVSWRRLVSPTSPTVPFPGI